MNIKGSEIIAIETPNSEGEFRYTGCDNCGNGLGNLVYETICYTKSWLDGSDPEGYFEVNLCSECIYSYHNGEVVADGCRNLFKI